MDDDELAGFDTPEWRRLVDQHDDEIVAAVTAAHDSDHDLAGWLRAVWEALAPWYEPPW